MNVQIVIVTRTMGKVSRFCAIGNSDRVSEGAEITYPIEGDTSTLTLFRDRILLKRRGSSCFDAEFLHGKSSFFRMSARDAAAELPLFTHVCKSFFSESEIFSKLFYDLGSGPSQKFFLKIHIKLITEQQ